MLSECAKARSSLRASFLAPRPIRSSGSSSSTTPSQRLSRTSTRPTPRPCVPEDIPWDIRFIEPVGDATYILPKVGDEEAELSEADLDVVAGGVSTLLFVGGFLVGAAVVGGMKWGADQLGL